MTGVYEWADGERARIEEQGTAHGLDYMVVVMEMGHRCGYVRVPSDHPWFERDYTDRADGKPWGDDENPYEFGSYDARIDVAIRVHGGLTFSGCPDAVISHGWWFGFDCAHLGDRPDPQLMSQVHREIASSGSYEPGSSHRSLDYVRRECDRLAQQLATAREEARA